ncbi:class I SAM-dependent methyltransferase [candidate division WOR-3 bacterium]|nr:class I SAM-dependent methyltransferase [candidate division WOR-3 bacterium]
MTKAYYLTVRTSDSSFFFEALYSAVKDPFRIEKSVYEKSKIENILGIIGKRKFNEILDIGCGNGFFSHLLLAVSNKVTGIDISSRAIKEANAKYGKFENLKFIRADIGSFTTKNRFDLFFCSEVLYYLRPEELEKTCTKIKKMTSGQSQIIFVGRADDEYVNRTLRRYFKEKEKFTFQSTFPLYFFPSFRVSRPYGIFVYEHKKKD